MGDRAYSIVAPKYWNNLPDDIRDLNLSLDIFKKNDLKLYIMFKHMRVRIIESNDCQPCWQNWRYIRLLYLYYYTS